MSEEYISRSEHLEFCKRIESENDWQNTRILDLENTVRQMSSLTVSVEKLAVNMDGMLKQLTEQNGRLKTLEGRDGENWRKIVSTVAACFVSAIAAFILARVGIG